MANLYIRYPGTTITGAVTVVQPDGALLHCTVDASALPSGAATSAKQPALGIAGTASTDVITVQGIASMVPLKVDASGFTLTVSGTVAATQSGTWSVGRTWSLLNSTDSVDAVQSGTWSVGRTWNLSSVSDSVSAAQSGTWNINNISGTISLPTGAATETTLSALNVKVPAQGQAAMAASLPVVIASDQSAIAISAASLPLPSGAATSAKQPALGTAGTASADVITVQGISGMVALKVDGSAVTQPVSGSVTVSGTVAATQSGTWSNRVTDGTNTAAVKAASTAAAATDPALVVAVSPNNTVATSQAGRTVRNIARIDYSSSNVTTSAYTQLLASTSGAVSMVEIFDSSGQTLVLATGGAGSEVNQIYIFPGGNGQVPLSIAASTRVSIKAVSATASTGEISVNFYA